MYSAIADQLDCIQLLLNRGATVGIQDASGQTALHWAAATVAHEYLYLFVCVRVIDIGALILRMT